MSDKRRYSEQEIEAIFKYAASAQELASQHQSDGQGLSLEELQKIGEGTGISPEFIAQAAAVLDGGGGSYIVESLFGFPLMMTKHIPLPGKMDDEDWERLVVDLRELFGMEGVLSQEGSFRKCVMGDMAVHVEPTNSGHRVRIVVGEQKKGANDLGLGFGSIMFLVSLIFWFQAFFLGKMTPAVVWPGIILLLVSLAPLVPLLFSHGWAAKHKLQIEKIVYRIKERAQLRSSGDLQKNSDVSVRQDEIAGSETNRPSLGLDNLDPDLPTEHEVEAAAKRQTRLRS